MPQLGNLINANPRKNKITNYTAHYVNVKIFEVKDSFHVSDHSSGKMWDLDGKLFGIGNAYFHKLTH